MEALPLGAITRLCACGRCRRLQVAQMEAVDVGAVVASGLRVVREEDARAALQQLGWQPAEALLLATHERVSVGGPAWALGPGGGAEKRLAQQRSLPVVRPRTPFLLVPLLCCPSPLPQRASRGVRRPTVAHGVITPTARFAQGLHAVSRVWAQVRRMGGAARVLRLAQAAGAACPPPLTATPTSRQARTAALERERARRDARMAELLAEVEDVLTR